MNRDKDLPIINFAQFAYELKNERQKEEFCVESCVDNKKVEIV